MAAKPEPVPVSKNSTKIVMKAMQRMIFYTLIQQISVRESKSIIESMRWNKSAGPVRLSEAERVLVKETRTDNGTAFTGFDQIPDKVCEFSPDGVAQMLKVFRESPNVSQSDAELIYPIFVELGGE
jgi:hypothetical protein